MVATAAPMTAATAVNIGTIGDDSVFKTFEDVAADHWAKNDIDILASKGVINGTTDKTFSPEANITRADFTMLLVKTLGLAAQVDTNFVDVAASDYYYEAVGVAKKRGIVFGPGEGKFNPMAAITRQEMMVIIARALKTVGKLDTIGTEADLNSFTDKSSIDSVAVNDIAACVKDGLVEGYNNLLNPHGNVTRAETAVLMYRVYNK